MKTKRMIGWTAGVLAGLVLSFTAAAAAEHWKFTIENKSNKTVNEFRTQDDDGKWTANWLSQRIEPGDTFVMDFNTEEGDCEVRTEIRFIDGVYFEGDVDYCKVGNIYLYDDHLSWD